VRRHPPHHLSPAEQATRQGEIPFGRLGRTPANIATLRSRPKASHFSANSRWTGRNHDFRTVGSNPTLSAIRAEKLLFFSAFRGRLLGSPYLGPYFRLGESQLWIFIAASDSIESRCHSVQWQRSLVWLCRNQKKPHPSLRANQIWRNQCFP